MKRYLHEKIRFIQTATENKHVLIVPGEKTELIEADRSRIYFIRAPLISRTTRYRALLNLRALGEIIERERPDIIESGDPYQLGWKTISAGHTLRIPVVAFYHSHFAEAYVRTLGKFIGARGAETLMGAARSYVRKLYNQFAGTYVPSAQLAEVLREWGVANVREVDLGVDTEIFRPTPDDSRVTRDSLGIANGRTVLLYVGRLAREKNTQTLFRSFELLAQKFPDRFQLLVIGDGSQAEQLRALKNKTGSVTWISYCADSVELARYYRAADLFVHPGVQETFGLVALESQACGTPVVGIRGSYMDRIILHDQQSWARENGPEALAEAIEQSAERDFLEQAARDCSIAAQRFSWPEIFSRIFHVYRQVIGLQQPTREAGVRTPQ